MRKRNFITLIIGFILLLSCNKEEKTTFEIGDLKWSLTIPENFKKVPEKDWDKVKDNGIETYEKVTDKNVENKDIENTIFAYKKGKFHTLESNYKTFDKSENYLKSNKELNSVTYETLKKAMPNTELDSISSKQLISGLEFDSFEINLNYENGEKLTTKSFRRIFGDKRISINILYRNKAIGKILIESLEKSKFE